MELDHDNLLSENHMRSNVYSLLYEGLPDFRSKGRLNVKALADAIGISRQALNQWFIKDRISFRQINKLHTLSNSELSLEELLEYSQIDA